MNSKQRLEELKRLYEEILSSEFRTSMANRRELLNQVVPLLKFDPFYYSNALEAADILSRPGFSTSKYSHSEARIVSMIRQAIAELEQNEAPIVDLPKVQKLNQTQLSAWSAISSHLFDTGDSDVICSIAGRAGLEVVWSLSEAESFSHKLRIRAYRPRVEAAFKKLDDKDQSVALAVIAAEIATRFPASFGSIQSTLTRIGWTIKTAPPPPAESDSEKNPMKRDTELQRLLLIQTRDGIEPPELAAYSEAQQVYNSALLISGGLVEGQIIRDGSGEPAGTVVTSLTNSGHDFLEKKPNSTEEPDRSCPVEIADSLKRFRQDHPDQSKCAFIMMRFGTTPAHQEIVQSIRDVLKAHGIIALRADDKDYHEDLFWNILTYIYGCGFGIAVFERIELEEFNPNVSLEVGYTMGLRRPVLLLKDRTLKSLNTDLIGRLYKAFDPQRIRESLKPEVERWLKDRGLV